MFDVYVISLPGSDRRAPIEKHLRSNDIPFQFIDAFDSRQLSCSEIDQLSDMASAISRYGRKLSRGEVGCFMSHRAVWERVIDTGRAAVVLEDDAIIDPKLFRSVVIASEDILSVHADIILLGRSKVGQDQATRKYFYEPLKWACQLNELLIGIPFKYFTSGSVGYWISLNGAKKAVDHANGAIYTVVDDWVWHRSHGGLRVSEVRPFVVRESFQTMPSSIESGRAPLSRRRQTFFDVMREPLRVVRALYRWTIVALLTISHRRDKIFGRAGNYKV